jgi:hypothetical protein
VSGDKIREILQRAAQPSDNRYDYGSVTELADKLSGAYLTLRNDTEASQKATASAAAARRIVEAERRTILAESADTYAALGKNEAAHDATIRARLAVEYINLDAAELTASVRRDALALAQIDVDALRAQLRCVEVIAALRSSVAPNVAENVAEEARHESFTSR